MKLDINYREEKKTWKKHKHMEIKQYILNEEITEEIRK